MNAVIYTRVSTKEQKETGHSLRDQKIRLEDYARNFNIKILAHFEDDSSGTNFERPGFQLLENFLKENKGKIDIILFTKWDRFARNAQLSMLMVAKLRALGVAVRAIEQEFDDTVPENMLVSAIYQVLPEIENHRRNRNTKTGMRRAMRDGYWVNNAPIGYKNQRDETGKPGLVFGDKVELIRTAFIEVGKGLSSTMEIWRALKKKGLNVSKSQFARLLKNPVYKGYIPISEWQDEPEELVRGRFDPIVDEFLFEKVQKRLKQKGRNREVDSVNESIFPLRGILYCSSCGKRMTASRSRSKTKTRHAYYHCQSPCLSRVSAKKVDKWLHNEFSMISLPKHVVDLYREIAKDVFRRKTGLAQQAKKSIYQEIEKLEERKKRSIRLYIDQKIRDVEYQMIIEEIDALIDVQNNKLADYNSPIQAFDEYFSSGVSLLDNLTERYERAPAEIKRRIISSIFPENIIFEGENYRTPRINEALTIIANKNNGLQVEANIKPLLKDNLSHLVARTGIEPVSPP